MRNLLVILAMFALALSPSFAKASKGSKVKVKQSTTKKGTVIKSHERTAPNKNKTDNWSTRGNVNPKTGKVGTKNPAKK